VATQTRQLGVLLKQWRRLRGKSQLALAIDARVSPRHLSFVESGRSQASREFLLTLADALDVPLRERNLLLAAGGFAAMYQETALTAEELTQLRSALSRLLDHQEPYPAVVLDRQWNLVQTNRAAPRLFAHFIDLDLVPQPRNLLRTMFNPAGLRPWIANWDVVANQLVHRVFREAVGGIPDDRTMALLRELQAYPPTAPNEALTMGRALPFHPVNFKKDALELSFFSMIASVGAPLDITAQELRIEAFFPADAVTEAFAQKHLRSDDGDAEPNDGRARRTHSGHEVSNWGLQPEP
jgi:transcriptional regulator with XRE-family HTH domain